MAKKQIEGWVVTREPKGDYVPQWYYTQYGAPYKRRGDALKTKHRLERTPGIFTYRLMHVSYFYEPDNE